MLPDIRAACPYLGLRSDPGTTFTFPSPGHCCFRCKAPQTPLLEHQKSRCLAADHVDCPLFSGEAGQPFPKEQRFKARRTATRSLSLHTLLPYGLAILLLLLVGWALFPTVFGTQTGTSALSGVQLTPTVRATVLSTRTSLPLLLPETATPAPDRKLAAASPLPPTDTPSPQPTGTLPIPSTPQVHALEMPVRVGEQQLIIHQVQEGESLELLAALYDTSTQALQAINVSLTSPLWAGSGIVIVPGASVIDPAFPAFDIYQVTAGQENIDAVARYLNVDAALLRDYNNCPQGCRLQAGDWLVIPRLK